MAKRSSLFGTQAATATPEPVEAPAPPPVQSEWTPVASDRKYPVAKTREGKRVATVYLEREALRQLQKIAFDEETTMQALLTEGVNAVFETRGLSRIA